MPRGVSSCAQSTLVVELTSLLRVGRAWHTLGDAEIRLDSLYSGFELVQESGHLVATESAGPVLFLEFVELFLGLDKLARNSIRAATSDGVGCEAILKPIAVLLRACPSSSVSSL